MTQVQLLKNICESKHIFIATAESVTVGYLQTLIAKVSGASNFFRGGITAYDIDQKVEILGVEREHAAQVDCVSPRVAAQMAFGATRLFNADIGVSTTGYAEPPEPQNNSVPYAFYSIWDKAEASSDPVRSGRLVGAKPDRVGNQRFYAEQTLRELVAYLASREGADLSFQDELRVERLADQRYRFGERIVKDLSDLPGAIRAVKKSIPITAVKLSEPFEVLTAEGVMQGASGDWLMQGVVGDVYVCPSEVFEKSYDYPL